MAWTLFLVLLLLACAPQALAVDGTFRGKVVEPPENQPAVPGWIFVQGRNRLLRRVEVSHAVIVFGDEIPASERRKCNSDCLSAGQEVRVTAQQDSAGEWRAKQVEILHLATRVAQGPPLQRTQYRPPADLGPGKYRALPIFTAEFALAQVTGTGNPASYRLREKSNFKYVSVRRYNEPVSQASPMLAGVCL